MTRHYSAALPIAYVVLRLLILFNWLVGAAIVALLVLVPNREWIMSAFQLSPSLDAERMIWGLRGVALLGLVTIPLNYLILKRLLAMVDTVRRGDAFVAANAQRLQAIGWRCSPCRSSASRSARSAIRFRPRLTRSISMRAFRSTAGWRCCSPSSSPACSPKAR